MVHDQATEATRWLNEQYASCPPGEDIEAWTSKLLLSQQQTSSRCQHDMNTILAQLPRLATAVTQSVPRTQTTLGYIVRDLDQLDHFLLQACTNSDIVHRIRDTQTVKHRMEDTYKSLENQDNWGTLMSNMRDMVASGDVEAISSRIQALKKCYLSLIESPNYTERTAQLDEIVVVIERAMSEKLRVTCLTAAPWKSGNQSNVVETRLTSLAQLFGVIDQMETFRRVVRQCRVEQLVKRWNEIALESRSDDGHSVEECIKLFYDDICAAFQLQLPLFILAFPDPIGRLQEVLIQVFDSVNPNIEKFITKTITDSTVAQDYLASLLEMRRSEEALCQSLDKLSQNHDCRQLVQTVRQPLKSVLRNYADIEETIIRAEFSKFETKSVAGLSSGAVRIGSLVYAAVVRCVQLTAGEQLPKLLDKFGAVLAVHLQSVGQLASVVTDSVGGNYRGSFLDDDEGYLALADLVKIMQHCGDLVHHLENVEEVLRKDHSANLPIDLFRAAVSSVAETAASVQKQTITLLLRPVDGYLDRVASLPSWSVSSSKLKADMPTFGLDPQEYMTSVGNFLLTLPQIMDPLLSSEHPSMKRLRTLLTFYDNSTVDESTGLTEKWIHAVIVVAVEKVVTALLAVRMMTVSGIRQMVCDLKYLQNVVEDFAIPLTGNFCALLHLLTVHPDEFTTKAALVPAEIANFVAKARNFD